MKPNCISCGAPIRTPKEISDEIERIFSDYKEDDQRRLCQVYALTYELDGFCVDRDACFSRQDKQKSEAKI